MTARKSPWVSSMDLVRHSQMTGQINIPFRKLFVCLVCWNLVFWPQKGSNLYLGDASITSLLCLSKLTSMLTAASYFVSELITSNYRPGGGYFSWVLWSTLLFLPSFSYLYDWELGAGEISGILVGFCLTMSYKVKPSFAVVALFTCFGAISSQILSASSSSVTVTHAQVIVCMALVAIALTLGRSNVFAMLEMFCCAYGLSIVASVSPIALFGVVDGMLWGAVYYDTYFPLIVKRKKRAKGRLDEDIELIFLNRVLETSEDLDRNAPTQDSNRAQGAD